MTTGQSGGKSRYSPDQRGRETEEQPSLKGIKSLERFKRDFKQKATGVKKQKTLNSTSHRLNTNDDHSSISIPKTLELSGCRIQNGSRTFDVQKYSKEARKLSNSKNQNGGLKIQRSITLNLKGSSHEEHFDVAGQNKEDIGPIPEIGGGLQKEVPDKTAPLAQKGVLPNKRGAYSQRERQFIEVKELETQRSREKTLEGIDLYNSNKLQVGGQTLQEQNSHIKRKMIKKKSSSEVGDTPKFRRNRNYEFKFPKMKEAEKNLFDLMSPTESNPKNLIKNEVEDQEMIKKKQKEEEEEEDRLSNDNLNLPIEMLPSFGGIPRKISGSRGIIRRMSSLKEVTVRKEDQKLSHQSPDLNKRQKQFSPCFLNNKNSSGRKGLALDDIEGDLDNRSISDTSHLTPKNGNEKGKLKGILKISHKTEAILRSNTHHELAMSVASYKLRKSPNRRSTSKKGRMTKVRFLQEPIIFNVESYKTYNKLMNVRTKPQKTCLGCILS